MLPFREITAKVYKTPLPEAINGISAPDGQDRFIILINEDLPEDEQAATFLHEMIHAWNNDHTRQGQDVNGIENHAREILAKAAGRGSN